MTSCERCSLQEPGEVCIRLPEFPVQVSFHETQPQGSRELSPSPTQASTPTAAGAPDRQHTVHTEEQVFSSSLRLTAVR